MIGWRDTTVRAHRAVEAPRRGRPLEAFSDPGSDTADVEGVATVEDHPLSC